MERIVFKYCLSLIALDRDNFMIFTMVPSFLYLRVNIKVKFFQLVIYSCFPVELQLVSNYLIVYVPLK